MLIEIMKKLKHADPFIYEICGDYYYLGSAIFRECSTDEIKAYKSLKQEFDFLRSLTYELIPKDCIKFNAYFDKVTSVMVGLFSEKKNTEAAHQICDLMKHLNEAQLKDLLKQHENFKEMINYRHGKYR